MHQPLKFTQDHGGHKQAMIPRIYAFSMARRRGDIRIVIVEIDVAAAADAVLANIRGGDVA